MSISSSRRPIVRFTASGRQRGFTLLEVLVSVVVLVMGVLGASAMTLTAIRNGQQAGTRSTAVALAGEASEIIRGNYTQYTPMPATVANTSLGTGIASTATCFTSGTGCSLQQMSQNDLFSWSQKVQTALPGGQAVICIDSGTPTPSSDTPAAPSCNGLGPTVVKLWWTEKSGNGVAATSSKPNMTVPIQPI
jgi:type IV pilus assembly protein PilV